MNRNKRTYYTILEFWKAVLCFWDVFPPKVKVTFPPKFPKHLRQGVKQEISGTFVKKSLVVSSSHCTHLTLDLARMSLSPQTTVTSED